MHEKDDDEKIVPDNEIYFYFQFKTTENFIDKKKKSSIAGCHACTAKQVSGNSWIHTECVVIKSCLLIQYLHYLMLWLQHTLKISHRYTESLSSGYFWILQQILLAWSFPYFSCYCQELLLSEVWLNSTTEHSNIHIYSLSYQFCLQQKCSQHSLV